MWPFGYLFGMCAFAAGIFVGTGWVFTGIVFSVAGLIFSLLADDKK